MKSKCSVITINLAVLLLLSGIGGTHAETADPDFQEENITLHQFLEDLRHTHPLFEREALSREIAAEELRATSGAEDWTVSSGAMVSHISHAPVTSGIEKTNSASVSGGVARHFWSTGGELSAGITLGIKRYDYLPEAAYAALPITNYDNEFSLAYTQPLLRNWGGVLSKLDYDLKSVEIELTHAKVLENQEHFLSAEAQEFLNWVFYNAEVHIAQERLQLSERLLNDTKRKRAYNLIDRVDVIRAENAFSLAKQNLVVVESNLMSLMQQLSMLLQDEDIKNKSPEFNLYEIHELPDLDTVTNNVRRDSRIFRQLDLTLKKLMIARDGSLEFSKPDLRLTAQAGANKYDESFGEALKIDEPQASLSISYLFPLKNTKAKANIRTIDLAIAQLNKQMDELEITQIATLSTIYVQLKQIEEILELNRRQIELARQKTREEMATYNRGKGDCTFVVQSQDDEEKAKLTYAQNALSYQKLYIQFLAITDQLLPAQ